MKVHCKETKTASFEMLLDESNQYFLLLRDMNGDCEKKQDISQILEDILVKLEDVLARFKQLISTQKCTKHDEMAFLERIDALEQFYLRLGSHDTDLFYEKNEFYQKLKSRRSKICCVCGIKTYSTNESDELKNAISYKHFLVVEDRELTEWKALKRHDEDELGALAQQCFHIAKVEYDDRYYHILNIENPSEDNELEKMCSLIKDGKLLKLPACNDCFDRLKKADKLWKETTETADNPSCSDSSKSNNGQLNHDGVNRCTVTNWFLKSRTGVSHQISENREKIINYL